METCRINDKRLYSYMVSVFSALGYSEADASRAANVLHYADLRGNDTHGIANLPTIYFKGIMGGTIKQDAIPTIRQERGAVAAIDAHGALGLLAGQTGMETAMNLANQFGIGCATVSGSSHFGAAGFYSEMAAQRGLIGMAMTNLGHQSVAYPLGSKDPIIGTNPISFAACAEGKPVGLSLDMSTTVVASGKIQKENRRGKKVPDGWLHTASGAATHDPSTYVNENRSGYLPMLGGAFAEQGGHKGLGLAMMVEVLCGSLSGAYTCADPNDGSHNSIGHFFLAIDPSFFGGKSLFDASLQKLLDSINSAEVHPVFPPIQHPGAPDAIEMQARLEAGVPLDVALMDSLRDIATTLKIEPLKVE